LEPQDADSIQERDGFSSMHRVRRLCPEQREETMTRTGLSLPAFSAALIMLLGSGQVAAESDLSAGSDRWAPGLVIRSGVVILSGSAFAQSNFGGGAPLRPRTTGRQTQVWPMLGGDLEIMTPAVSLIPGAPRFFARGGASYSFAGDKDVAKEGNPRNFEPPIPTQATLVNGRGSSTNIEMKSPVWDAGLGVAFEFEAWDRPVRLRASVEYMRQRIKLRGKVHEARDIFGSVALFSLRETTTDDFDAVGGGLGLEFDVLRAGPIMTSVLSSGRFYHYVGGRVIRTDQTGPLGTSALWRYKLDPWAYRLHVGVRFRWQPE
jgi:hypothetical protein